MPRYLSLFLFLCLTAVHSFVSAAEITWIGPIANQSGNWSNAENWDTGNVPSAGDRAFITAGGSFTVTLDVTRRLPACSLGSRSKGPSRRPFSSVRVERSRLPKISIGTAVPFEARARYAISAP